LDVTKGFIDEITLEFSSEMVSFQSFDKMSAALLKFKLLPRTFARYHAAENMDIKVNIHDLLQVLEAGADGDLIRISIRENQRDTTIVHIAGTSNARFQVLCLENGDTVSLESDPMGYAHETLGVLNFVSIVKHIRALGEVVDFKFCETSNECIFQTRPESGIRSAEFTMSPSDRIQEDHTALLGTDYLAKVSKDLSLSLVQKSQERPVFTIGMNADYPCLFQGTFGLGTFEVYGSQREKYNV
jgi:hypothetical protein